MKKKTKRRKKLPGGTTARVQRFLGRWLTWALCDKRGHAEFLGMKRFYEAAIQPYKERGDKWANVLLNISTLLPVSDERPASPAYEDLYPRIKAELEHLHELRDGRLNYDDMRSALEALHCVTWPWWCSWRKKERILESTGASKALIGASVSDAGEMRRALQTVDARLTALLRSIDTSKPEPLDPEAIMQLWELIHASRKALKARMFSFADPLPPTVRIVGDGQGATAVATVEPGAISPL